MPFFNDNQHERRIERQQDTIERQRDTIERQRDLIRNEERHDRQEPFDRSDRYDRQDRYELRDYQQEPRDYRDSRDGRDFDRMSAQILSSPMGESTTPVFHPSRPNTKIIMSPGRGKYTDSWKPADIEIMAELPFSSVRCRVDQRRSAWSQRQLPGVDVDVRAHHKGAGEGR